MSVLARVYLAWRRDDPHPGLALLAVFWMAIAVSILVGSAHFDGHRLGRGDFVDPRPKRRGCGAPPGAGDCLKDVSSGADLVHRHLLARRQPVSGRFGRRGDGWPSIAEPRKRHTATAGPLFVVVLRHLLSGLDACGGLAAPAVWAVRREPAARFLLAWRARSWIVFELVVTKLPHYALPLYPAIAIFIAGGC